MNIANMNRKIYGARDFTIKSWMATPTVIPGKGGSVNISCSPTVFLSYDPKTEYGAERPKDTSFKMNVRNQYRVRNFFGEILHWFTSDAYKDLFIIDEHSGSLMINMEFRGVKQLLRGTKFDSQVIAAVPVVVELDGASHAGAAISVNQTAYTALLIDTDIEAIFGIIDSFSFQSEAQLLMSFAYNQALWTDRETRFTNGGNAIKVKW